MSHLKCVSLKVSTTSTGLGSRSSMEKPTWQKAEYFNTAQDPLKHISAECRELTLGSNVWCLWSKRRMPGVAELQILLHGTGSFFTSAIESVTRLKLNQTRKGKTFTSKDFSTNK